MTPVVAARHLERRFSGPPDVLALEDATFDIAPGEFVALTGPSGSGKTTLLALLGLIDVATGGEYRLNGRDVSGLSERQLAGLRAYEIGIVYQAFHLIDHRSVDDNVRLGLVYQGGSRSRRDDDVRAIVEQVGLGHRAGASCSTLSGGEKQRVAIARALIRRPALLLCDEPTGNLDSVTSAQILDLIAELHHDGLTVLIITHDEDVSSRAERVLSISDGVVADSDGAAAGSAAGEGAHDVG